MQRGVGGHTLNAVVCVQVFVHRNLEQRRSSLTVFDKRMTEGKLVNRVTEKKHGGLWNIPSDNNGPREEEEPDAVESEGNKVSLTPMHSNQGYLPAPVLLNNLVLIRDPVLVPSVDSSGVMDTQDIDRLHLESSILQLSNDRTRISRV